VRRLALLLLFLPTLALAQSGVWGLRGITKRFVVRSGAVYTIDGRGVAAYDAATLARLAAAETNAESLDGAFVGDTLTVLTTAGFERFTPDLARIAARPAPPATRMASNGTLIAAAGPDGVRIYDGEQLIGFSPHTQAVRALVWHGDALIAATASNGIPVLDSNAAPIVTIGETAFDVAVDGDLLFTASGANGLAIYDIGNLAAPRLLSRTADGEGFYRFVAAGGGRAVLSDGTTIRAFDVTTPAAPKAFAPSTQPVDALAMNGARLFVAGSTFDSLGIERGSGVPVRELDLAQPATPALLGEAHDLAGPVSGAATDGSLAFVVDPPFFRVLDVSTTAAPKEIASLQLDDIEPYVKSQGSRVLLYGNGKARFIDASTPYRPRVVGTFDSTAVAHDAAAIAPNAFLEGNALSGFHVFDFLADGRANFIGGIKTHSVDIVANGNAVYYSVEFANVGVADITSGVTRVAVLPIPAIQLAMAGDLLLMRDSTALRVFSTADPFAPSEVGSVPLAPGGLMAAEDGAGWLAKDGTITGVDLSDPANPTFQPTGFRVVAPSQMAATNGKVVVADRYGLRVFGPDTAAPAPPPPTTPPRRRVARP
jgi:hypothetical protein